MKSQHLISDNFLLENDLAIALFETAKTLPLVDYHNHVNPAHAASDRKFTNISELWINEDPYKHRAMRINGIAEQGITGAASDRQKFLNWAKTVPKTLGNPLFHWTALELMRVFEIEEMLTAESAERIWKKCKEKLDTGEFSEIKILQRWNIEILCTSDDWLDDLEIHRKAMAVSGIRFFPSLRADKIMTFSEGFLSYSKKLAELTRQPISNLNDLKTALTDRLAYFQEQSCKISDHALDGGFIFDLPSEEKAQSIFNDVLQGKTINRQETVQLQSYLLTFLGNEYGKLGWTMQLHIGAQRYTSSRLRRLAGGAGGYACIGQATDISSLCRFLDTLEQGDNLPGVILYTLNPADNAAFASLTGSFAEDGKPGKIQFGPAWWYNDHITGIIEQLTAISNYGLLSRFIGMTTDSRSILSFSRHEFFRRILCNLLAEWVAKGWLPYDEILLKQLVKDISYNNSKKLFIHDQ